MYGYLVIKVPRIFIFDSKLKKENLAEIEVEFFRLISGVATVQVTYRMEFVKHPPHLESLSVGTNVGLKANVWESLFSAPLQGRLVIFLLKYYTSTKATFKCNFTVSKRDESRTLCYIGVSKLRRNSNNRIYAVWNEFKIQCYWYFEYILGCRSSTWLWMTN